MIYPFFEQMVGRFVELYANFFPGIRYPYIFQIILKLTLESIRDGLEGGILKTAGELSEDYARN